MSLHPYSSRDQLRVGDRERDITCTELARHFSAGRLTESEMEDRTASALQASTHRELYDLLADLPRSTTPAGVVHTRASMRIRSPRPRIWDAFVGFVSISAFICLVLLFLTTAVAGFPGGPILVFLGALGGSASMFGAWHFLTIREEPRCNCGCAIHS